MGMVVHFRWCITHDGGRLLSRRSRSRSTFPVTRTIIEGIWALLSGHTKTGRFAYVEHYDNTDIMTTSAAQPEVAGGAPTPSVDITRVVAVTPSHPIRVLGSRQEPPWHLPRRNFMRSESVLHSSSGAFEISG